MQIPEGIYCRIAPRSVLSLKGVSIEAGVIDNDYRGEVVILMRNHTKANIKIRNGQRAAQSIFEQASKPCLILSDNINGTNRGDQGFGSTDTRTFDKRNKEEAVACALQVAMETEASKQSRAMHNTDLEDNDHLMQSTHKPVQREENKHYSPPCKAVQNLHHPTESEIPTLPTDRVNSSLPKHMSMSKDFIIQATGYHKSNMLMKHFHTISNNNVSISTIEKNHQLKKEKLQRYILREEILWCLTPQNYLQEKSITWT